LWSDHKKSQFNVTGCNEKHSILIPCITVYTICCSPNDALILFVLQTF